MKHTRIFSLLLGWGLILCGLMRVADYSVLEVREHFFFRSAMGSVPMQPNYDAMTKEQLLSLRLHMERAADELEDMRMTTRRGMIWSGLLMLAGAIVIQVASLAKGSNPNKFPHVIVASAPKREK